MSNFYFNKFFSQFINNEKCSIIILLILKKFIVKYSEMEIVKFWLRVSKLI